MANPSLQAIKELLETSRTIAVVGLSQNPARSSYAVGSYLKSCGYRVIAVNPRYDQVLGERCYASLLEVGEPIDIVDIFRRPEAVPEIVDQAIAIGARAVWMQDGVVHEEAAERARRAGLIVVMDRCILRDHSALF